MPIMNLEEKPTSFWGVLFSYAFRPLFLCVALFAMLLIFLWLLLLTGRWVPVLALPSTYWHAHEMLFGVVSAGVGGFLLTAVATWTQRPPVKGSWLVALAASWLLGRAVIYFSAQLPYVAVAVLDSVYSLLLLFLMSREVIRADNRRNYKVLVMLLLLALGNVVFHWGVMQADWSWVERSLRLAMMLVCVLIALIGGRVTPNFTRNYLLKSKGETALMPVPFNQWDRAVSLLLGTAGISWTIWPVGVLPGALLVLAGIGQWLRVVRWQGWQVREEPLLWVLHLGFIWLGAGLVLLGLSAWELIGDSAGLHALGIGAMAGMLVGIAARAALGHTQRPLVAGRVMALAFVLISASALVRVLASLAGVAYLPLLLVAGGLWLIAFALFAWRYVPVLIQPARRWR